MIPGSLSPNMQRLTAEIEKLSTFSDAPAPAVTRILYTEQDMAAREYLRSLAMEAGFDWRTDSVGNTFIRWQGATEDLSPVATGSHTDAIPYSGKYDGVVGVLGGLEAMRSLKEAGFQPQRSIDVIMFTSEEPTRFGLGCIGSRVLSGQIDPSELMELVDEDGVTFEEARTQAGFTGTIADATLVKEHYNSFVELHIEQGPVLEAKGIPIGVVTGIAASSTSRLTFDGNGGHAGTVPMSMRNDPFLGASEAALYAEQIACEYGSDAVTTIGQCTVHPGASNSIPRQVVMSLDVRHVDRPSRDEMLSKLKAKASHVAANRALHHTFEVINLDPALECAEAVTSAVRLSAHDAGLPSMEIVSRAYHDTVFMGAICPVGMIFIPCKDGYSHRPEEFASEGDITAGVSVLARTLAKLSMVY